MNLYILSEPAFHDSSWYLDILRGIKRAKNARNLTLCHGEESEEFATQVKNDTGVLLLPSSSHAWRNAALDFAFKNSLYPLIIGTLSDDFLPPYCLITQDYVQSAYTLYRKLQADGYRHIAFFGHNPDSDGDAAKLRGLLLSPGFSRSDVFDNNGDISATVQHFLSRMQEFDAVIFANDYVGVALLHVLKDHSPRKNLRFACFGSGIILREKCPSMLFSAPDFTEAGKKAAELYPFLCKNHGAISMRVTIKNGLDTTLFPRAEESGNYEGAFYADPVINRIMRLERVLEHSDPTDRAMLTSLSQGNTLEETADACHMSISGIKYRISRLKSIGDYPHTADLIRELQEW